MDIFGFNPIEIIKNPVSGLLGGVVSVALFSGYKILIAKLKPERAIDEFFDKICDAIVYADNNFIDKIRIKKIKEDVQNRVDDSLARGIQKIEATRKEISD